MSRLASLALHLGLLAVLPLLPGCPSNSCLIEFNGRCEISTCGERQAFDNWRRTCVCKRGFIAAGSGCYTQAEANRYCGRASIYTPTGCAPMQCQPGFVLDLEREQCIPRQAVDQAAGAGPGQTLGCQQGTVLVVNGGVSSCIPVEQSCSRDEYWSGQACVKLPTCPTGFEIDAATRQCVQVAQRPDRQNERPTIDVDPWVRANYGPPGGQGAPALCGPLARKPLSFGVLPGGTIRLVVAVGLTFPKGVTDDAVVTTQAIVEASGQPVSPQGAQELQSVAESIASSLRIQRGKASAPAASTQVKCLIVNAAAPQIVPATGGA